MSNERKCFVKIYSTFNFETFCTFIVDNFQVLRKEAILQLTCISNSWIGALQPINVVIPLDSIELYIVLNTLRWRERESERDREREKEKQNNTVQMSV